MDEDKEKKIEEEFSEMRDSEEERSESESESENESKVSQKEGVQAGEGEVDGRRGGTGGEEELVMDTPERSKNQIATPISKFEDSPVFNFLNSLSPIRPVKSTHLTQSLNSLSFASIPSIFTSPHVSSMKEPRCLRRHQLSDLSKPEFSSGCDNKIDSSQGVLIVYDNSTEAQGLDTRNCTGEASTIPSHECSKLAVEFARSSKYENNTLLSCLKPTNDTSTEVGDFAASSGVQPFVDNRSDKGDCGGELDSSTVNHMSQNKGMAECDWESLISDAADLFIFDSPSDTEALKTALDPNMDSQNYLPDEVQNCQDLDGPKDQVLRGSELDNPSTQPGDRSEFKEFAETQNLMVCSTIGSDSDGVPNDKVQSQTVSNLYRGMRRRCLVFEMAGGRRKHLDESTSSLASMVPPSDGDNSCGDNPLLSVRSGHDSSRCILPGIGLHLNALASTPNKVAKNEALASGKQLVIAPGSGVSYHSLTITQESMGKSIVVAASEKEIGPIENAVPIAVDASLSGCPVNEDLNQTSPKKKRRRLEQGESEACKRCNCKKSKCLKLYCECFAAGVYCVEPCSCQDCFNKPIHEDTVLATRKQIESRNPLAFAPKVIRGSESVPESGDDSSRTPASARHKRGCNCKKSGCLKKYCECYQGGVGCSINCRCEGCKNAFGRKDGMETDLEEEEADQSERSVVDRSSLKNIVNNDPEPSTDSVLPETPMKFARPSLQLPFSSKNKPPRSSYLSIGSSSTLYHGQGIGRRNFFPPQPKFDKPFETVREDDLPDILQGNGSPISTIKSGSPNSKRVSPPHSDFGVSSPGRRSSRKLILQSIPSFPSLTPKH